MNVSDWFIRRPIATSLLMAAIALFGVLAYRELPVSNLPNVDFPTINVNASLPGGDPDHDVVGGRQPARAAVHDDRRHRLDDLVELARQHRRHAAVRSRSATSTAPRSTCRPRSPKRCRCCRPACRRRPAFKKVNPADEPFLHLALTSQTVPLWILDDYAETLIAPRDLDGAAASRRCR